MTQSDTIDNAAIAAAKFLRDYCKDHATGFLCRACIFDRGSYCALNSTDPEHWTLPEEGENEEVTE